MSTITNAVRSVMAERARQQEVEGWTAALDDGYKNDELITAAGCYTVCNLPEFAGRHPADAGAWPWAPQWWKPSDRRRNLVKACALLLAEIERLDRQGEKP